MSFDKRNVCRATYFTFMCPCNLIRVASSVLSVALKYPNPLMLIPSSALSLIPHSLKHSDAVIQCSLETLRTCVCVRVRVCYTHIHTSV